MTIESHLLNAPCARPWLAAAGALLLCLATADRSLAEPDDERVDFAQDVVPVLSDRCFLCHGPDSQSREADLRLDQFDFATALLDSGNRAIVPGDSEASELVRRITSADPSERMPPPDSGKELSEAEAKLLARWIAQGAPFERHWAFEPIRRPPVPPVTDSAWVRNPIDNFVLAKLESAGLEPSPPADRKKLARRIHFDLIGIPPTPTELHQFDTNRSPDPLPQLIDQLLASPHYGERMAMDWLDGARYADSNGYQNDFARTMWPWRDWVIEAYNHHMPLDRFIVEQLAGDLLPNPTRSQRVATGFNRNNRTVTEAGSIEEEWLVENVVDRVETTSTVFLGLTMGCARCHDHKYDPISQREFFQFFAFFNNVAERGVVNETRGNVPPKISLPTPQQEAHLRDLDQRIAELRERRGALESQTSPEQQFEQLEQLAGQSSLEAVAHLALTPDDNRIGADASHLQTSGGSSTFHPVTFSHAWPGPVARFHRGGLVYGDIWGPHREAPFTCSLWVRPTSQGTLVSRMDCPNRWRGFDISVLEGNRLSVHLIHSWPGNGLKVTSTASILPGRWNHCTVTYDGSSRASGIRCYINGQQVELEIESDNLKGTIHTTEPLRLGQRSHELYFEGELADVRFFDRALTPTEVQQQLARQLIAAIQHQRSLPEGKSRTAGLKEATELVAKVVAPRREALSKALRHLIKERKEYEANLPSVMVMQEREELRPTYLLKRGLYDQPDKSEALGADVPAFLPPLDGEGPHNRLDLANWIVSRENPLTARVIVNRAWTRFFGQGLVETPENFGVQARPPSHPQLLDWLAMELIESNWNLQHVQRLILTSATYQQTSIRNPALHQRDPNNVLLARGARVRLPAELIRDQALAVSGLLTPAIGGPSVMPYQPEGLWSELAGGSHETYTQDHGESLYRRSLYTYRKRTVPHPSLSTFDAPSWEICQIKRSTTNTPQQALALLNDVTYLEAARNLAVRVLDSDHQSSPKRLAMAFSLLTARQPTDVELEKLCGSLDRYQQHFAADPTAAKQFLEHGESPRGAPNVDDATLAAYTAVASLMLNLDEAIVKD